MNLKKKIFGNFIWRLLERFGAQGVTVIVSIILARLLNPEVYGAVALITVITSILQTFLDCGFSTALIQKKDADDADFSSVFYFSLFSGLILYLLLFLASPWIAAFYRMPELVPVIRVIGLTLVIYSLKSVQQAYVSRHMLFKNFFFATLGGTVGAAIIGIALAYCGFGIWALAAQHVFNTLVDTIILWIMVGWRPKAVFSFVRLKTLLKFGWKMLASGMLDKTYSYLRQMVIGRTYSPSDLAFYNEGYMFPYAVVASINSSIDSVLLPSMADYQDDILQIKEMTQRAIKTSTYIMMPMMTGIAVCARTLVNMILTPKWLPSVPYIRIFCLAFAFYPVHTANLNAIKAMGRSDLFLKLEIIKKTYDIIILLITMRWGPMIMAYSILLSSALSQIVNSWPNRMLLNYRYSEQLKDMLPQIGLSCLMGLIVSCIALLGLSDIVTLLIQIPLGIAVYAAGSLIFRIDSFEYILSVLRQYIPKKSKEK